LKEDKPLVSILITTYNSEKYIKECLESILNQTYKNLEIIIIDDCSKDNTLNILKEYKDNRIKIYSNKHNLGISKNLNKGLNKCNGEYIAIMDSDDWSYPDRIKKQVKLMEDNQKTILCGGYMDICDENLNYKTTRTYPTTDKEIRKIILRYNPISHPAIMWRKEKLLKTNLYPLWTKNTCHDYALVLEASQYGELRNIPEPLIKYRVRKNSVTGKKIRQTQLFSTYLQLKACIEYGLKATKKDKMFIIMRSLSTFVLPTSFQRKIANKFNYKNNDVNETIS